MWDFHVDLLFGLELAQQKCTIYIHQICYHVPHQHEERLKQSTNNQAERLSFGLVADEINLLILH